MTKIQNHNNKINREVGFLSDFLLVGEEGGREGQ
jgi:hypothetical protein